MIKAEEFTKLINKIKEKELQKQKRIQEDKKLTEEALNDLYIKIEKNINLGLAIPKYVEIPKILEKEVQENIVIEQGFFLDITKQGHTRIYYNKEDFEGRVKNGDDQSYPMVDIIHKVNEDLTNINNKQNKEEKEKPTTMAEDNEFIDFVNIFEKFLNLKDDNNNGNNYDLKNIRNK